MLWTEATDVIRRWADAPDEPNYDNIEALIEDAEDTILGEFSDIQERIDDGSLPIVRVQKVVARMVIRHLRNPAGLRTVQDTTGPYTTSTTYGGEEPGSLYLTDQDRNELAGVRVGQQAFTVSMFPIETENVVYTPITEETI